MIVSILALANVTDMKFNLLASDLKCVRILYHPEFLDIVLKLI